MPISTEALFEGLTPVQREAVAHVDGPLLVLAGPGSGKTTVVTRRVAHLIAQGIPPWQILALTFTNKAAGEMRERIERLLPENLPGKRGLTIATFHSFCARLLRRYGAFAGLPERFSIYDSGDQRDAIKLALKEAGMDSKNWTPGSVAAAISHAKNQLVDAAAYAQQASDFQTRSIAKAYAAYAKILKKNDALDFDDLLVVTAKLLRDNAQVRGELQERFQYLLIDEYQDTNYAQFVIAHSLASAPPRSNICVVGDPDQSIYGWRGADIKNILDFERTYPNAKIVPLGQNFRSTGHIVQAAATLIANNRRRKDKRLHTELGQGEKPIVITCFDEHHEASLIVEEFRRRHDAGNGEKVAWKDMAVLYRINALSRVMEEAFRNANIPYVIARGTAFYDRKEVKDALAYLRLTANPNDEVSLRRIVNVPARGIGDTTIDRVESYALHHQLRLFEAMRRASQISELSARAQNAIAKFVALVDGWREAAQGGQTSLLAVEKAALATLVERIVRESGLEATYKQSRSEEDLERLENINELINAAAEFTPPAEAQGGVLNANDNLAGAANGEAGLSGAAAGPGSGGAEASTLSTLNAYLESVALVSDADAIDPANGAVTLMTLHAAKGLEFTVVALAGLEEGLLPHTRAATSDAELEEERRLAFVGITRAKRRLLITHALFRTNRGLRERTIPSQFLRELPAESVDFASQAGNEPGWDAADSKSDPFGDRDPFGSPRRGRGADDRPWNGAARNGDRAATGSGFSGRRASGGLGGIGRGGGGSVRVEFPVGSLVNHPKFGLGRVEAFTPRATGSSVQVAFSTVGRKTLIVEYAKLERVE